MNGVLGFVLAVLIYPGVVVALIAAWALSWARQSARVATAASGGRVSPLRDAHEIRSALGRDTIAPEGVHPWALTLGSTVAVIAPIIALALLPVPGNPLARSIGLVGDLTAEGALLLAVPSARLFVGWAVPSPFTRLAADRGARLLAGAVAPMALALSATAEQFSTLGLSAAPTKTTTIALATRILAAAAFCFTLPVLARAASLRSGEGNGELLGGELAEISGRDLAYFRIGETIQLVAVSALFVAAFILPIFAGVHGNIARAVIWIGGLVVTAAGIGAWEGYTGRQPQSAERPPLSWWVGWPVLLALLALVAAAWAARGS